MANENDYIPEGSGTDGKVQEGDDLKSSSKDTLGSYLSSLTSVNHYPISDNPRIETSLEGSSGLPAEFETGGQDSTEGFTDTFPTGPGTSGAAVNSFETLSDSGKIETLGSVLDKNAQRDGHNLLRDVASNLEDGEPGIGDTTGRSSMRDPANASELQLKISEMLRTGNRFDPLPESSPYIEDGSFTEPGIPITQGGFGIYDDEAVRTSLEDIHKIAHSLMMRSTGHAMSNSTDPDSVSAISTNDVQMGSATVNAEKLRPTNAYLSPDKLELQNAELRYDDITGAALEPQRSYGQLSNYRETFEDGTLANLNTMVQALGEYLLGAAVFTAITTLVELLDTTKETHKPSDPKSLTKGKWHNDGVILRMARQFGIPDLNRPAWKCAIYGFAAWLKLPPSALPDAEESPRGIPGVPGLPDVGVGEPSGWDAVIAWFSDIAASGDDILFNALYAHGYYATVMRVVRRDLEKMLTEITSTAPGGIPGTDTSRAIFEILMNLSRYPSWNFFTAILRMGDAWLSSYNKYINIDGLAATGQTRQQMSRQRGTNKQSWRHRSSPALVLLNQKFVNASTAFGYNDRFFKKLHNTLGDKKTRDPGTPYYNNLGKGRSARGLKNEQPLNKIRYSREDVIKIENELDAEYCPFYFHDLRTNEVLSFNAFLGDVKDSYSVAYAESGGYGRIDKVKIYQDTTRNIALTWTLVATAPADFDSMWWSINKLVSMIYPQFSMGKPVKFGNKKFVMPFSQIPTASPVIRLRVGDVVRSNYSRFNLARLFGLSEIKLASADGTGSRELSEAPFSISEPREAAVDAAREEDEAAAADAARNLSEEMDRRFGAEPSSVGDTRHGYLPGDPNWGKAILRASSGGYTTYDTGPGITVSVEAASDTPTNTYNTNRPASGATHVEMSAFASRPSTDGIVTVFERVMRTPGDGESMDGEEFDGQYAEYYVQYAEQDDGADPYRRASRKGHFHTYVVTSDDLEPIEPAVNVATADPLITRDQQIDDVNQFFDPRNNAIVRSFEAAGGRGLAGVITSIDFDWNEAQWDMGGLGRRAPTMVSVSINFSPIHDIVPGLDNNGMMRAMNYPVGQIAGPMGTDFHDPGGIRSSVASEMSDTATGLDVEDARSQNYDNFNNSLDSGGEAKPFPTLPIGGSSGE